VSVVRAGGLIAETRVEVGGEEFGVGGKWAAAVPERIRERMREGFMVVIYGE
jgi:hypothetical protein